MNEMNYFRFLFWETDGCLLHYGEVRDTYTGDSCRFFCLKGTGNCAAERKAPEKLPFLFPKTLDGIVIEEWNPCTEALLERILSQAEVKRLIFPEPCGGRLPEFAGRVREAVSLSGREEETQSFTAGGWRFRIRGCGEGKLMLLHRLAKDGEAEAQDGSREEETCKATLRETPEKGQRQGRRFEDGVMHVKEMDGFPACQRTAAPDGYGCALGCILHRDHDVCRYSCDGKGNPQLAGTVVLPELPPEELERAVKFAESECREDIRFFVTGQPEAFLDPSGDKETAARQERKRYFISSEQACGAETIARICRSGRYRAPVLLEEGEGLCCSGFLKYEEKSGEPEAQETPKEHTSEA